LLLLPENKSDGGFSDELLTFENDFSEVKTDNVPLPAKRRKFVQYVPDVSSNAGKKPVN
jgi:hypothetical protein